MLKCFFLESLLLGGSYIFTLPSSPPIPLVVLVSFAGSLDLKGQEPTNLLLDLLLFIYECHLYAND